MEQGLHISGRLLIANHLDRSKYLASQEFGEVNKYDLTVFIRLFQGYERCALFLGHSTIPMHPLDLTTAPHPTFFSVGPWTELLWRCSQSLKWMMLWSRQAVVIPGQCRVKSHPFWYLHHFEWGLLEINKTVNLLVSVANFRRFAKNIFKTNTLLQIPCFLKRNSLKTEGCVVGMAMELPSLVQT